MRLRGAGQNETPNIRCVTAAVASRQAAWSTLVLVSQLESYRQVRQPSRIRLIVEFYDVLGNIDIGRRKKNRRILRGSIQDGHVPVLASVAVQHIDHFAADAIEHFGLRRVYIFLVFVLFALQLARFGFAFALQARLLVWTEFSAAGIDARTQIVDLLVQPFQLALARRKLRLQFCSGLLAFGGAGNGLAHVNDAEFRSRGRSWRGALRLQRASAKNAGSGQECD